jgi:pyrroloquinoline quinone biosynthesis protein E
MLRKLKKIKQLKLYEINRPNINMLGNICVNRFLGKNMIFPPYKIDVEPTTRCNLNCIFCQVPAWSRSRIKDMTLDDFKNIINKFPYLKSIKLQGMGEPFLNKDLSAMVDFCNQKGIYSTIFNNGTVIDGVIIKKLFKSPPLFLIFSLDSPNRDTYKILRGKDMFDKVTNNIRLSVAERNYNGSNARIEIWCVLNKYNFTEINDLISLAKDFGVDCINVQTKLTCFSKKALKKKNDIIAIDISATETANMLNNAKDFAQKINQSFNVYTGDYFSENRPCTFLKNSMYISVEGEVVPCCIIADPGIISLGNIHSVNSIDEIWNNRLYQNLRTAIKEKSLPSFCENCYL